MELVNFFDDLDYHEHISFCLSIIAKLIQEIEKINTDPKWQKQQKRKKHGFGLEFHEHSDEKSTSEEQLKSARVNPIELKNIRDPSGGLNNKSVDL